MSQELVFTFKKEKEEFCGGWLSTTPARILSDNDIFSYTIEEKNINSQNIKEAIVYVEEKIEKINQSIEKYKIKKQVLFNLNISSAEIYEIILDDFNGIDAAIEEYRNEQEDWEYIKSMFMFIKHQLDYNSDWKLYYTNR